MNPWEVAKWQFGPEQWGRLFEVAREVPGREAWWTLYDRYLTSHAWSIKRQERMEADGHQCQCCLSAAGLQVHHLRYNAVGNEPMADLVTLCRPCHGAAHGMDQPPSDGIWSMQQILPRVADRIIAAMEPPPFMPLAISRQTR